VNLSTFNVLSVLDKLQTHHSKISIFPGGKNGFPMNLEVFPCMVPGGGFSARKKREIDDLNLKTETGRDFARIGGFTLVSRSRLLALNGHQTRFKTLLHIRTKSPSKKILYNF
jgi:hypothetical protein